MKIETTSKIQWHSMLLSKSRENNWFRFQQVCVAIDLSTMHSDALNNLIIRIVCQGHR